MSTPKEPEVEEKSKKPKTPLEKLRAAAFNTDPAKGPAGEWTGLKWKTPEQGTKFQVHGSQGILVDEHDKPIVLDEAEASVFFTEITKSRPGDGVRLVSLN